MVKRKLSLLLSVSLLLSGIVPFTGAAAASTDGGLTPRVGKQHLQRPANGASLQLNKEALSVKAAHADNTESSKTSLSPFTKSTEDEAEALVPAEGKNLVPASASSEEITVIVELTTKPAAVHAAEVKQGLAKSASDYNGLLAKEQADFVSLAKKTLAVKLTHQYSQVFNGYSLKVPANRVPELAALPGVKAVYPSQKVSAVPVKSVSPYMNDSAPFIGVHSYWDNSYDGAGIKVGVIDTGIDYHHPSLEGAYKGGWDFVDNDNDPMETPVDPNDPEAATSHGTHVSGTIVGRGDPTNPDGPTGWVKGIAPAADLYVYRVLGPGGHGTDADVIAAVERAVADGLDVINLSLGGEVNSQVSADSVALNNAVLAGVVVVAANGNTGPGDFTTGSPAAAKLPISVGASSPPGIVELGKAVSSVTGATYYDLRVMAYQSGADYKALSGQALDLVYVGLGAPADYTGKNVTGKIALIKRGELTFVNKIVNAKKAGAAAAIIFNRDDLDGFSGVLLEDSITYLPTFDLKGTDGRAILAALDAAGSGTFTVSDFTSIGDPGDAMGDFSSRGPALPGLDIKPDISAPGVAIRSSVPAIDGSYTYAYEVMQGTSMAAPHVAGAAALVLQKQPELEPNEVKALFMNSAVQLKDGNTPYSHMVQGAGRIDLSAAIAETAVALVEDTVKEVAGGVATPYHTGSISFGSVAAGATVSRVVDVRDIASRASTYQAAASWIGPSAGTLTVDTSSIAVLSGGETPFTVSLAVAAGTPAGRYEGEVVLTETGGNVLRIPVAVYVGKVELPAAVTSVKLVPDIFSPNGDGLADTTDLSFKVTAPNGYLSLDVFDGLTSEWLGTVAEADTGLDPGAYKLTGWNAVVTRLQNEKLADGFYLLVPFVGNTVFDAEALEDQLAPFVVDTHAPKATIADTLEVAASGTTGIINGQVTADLLVDLFGDYSGIHVAALFEENGKAEQVDGTIADNGRFTIPVPVHPGSNEYEVYVYDEAYNGVQKAAFTLKHDGAVVPVNSKVSAVPVKSEAAIGEVFALDVKFADTADLYSAEFSLTYDATLTKGSVEAGTTLRNYQAAHHPTTNLIVQEKTEQLAGGLVRSSFVLSLTGDIPGVTGSGDLATFKFSSAKAGDYPFVVSGVRFLSSTGAEIDPGTLVNGLVKVKSGGGGPDPVDLITLSGSIAAEGFGKDIAYNEVWYSGNDGKLAVTVEALDAGGTVVKLGTVQADGTYSLAVPAGAYTIRVVVPGHIAATAAVVADAAKTVNFGPLTAGDVNGDGKVDLADLNQAARAFDKGEPWASIVAASADINRDGSVNLLDISYILANYGAKK